MRYEQFVYPLAYIAVVSLAGVFVVEMGTLSPNYVNEPAIVRKIVKDSGRVVTLARFDDGSPAEYDGDAGEPGEQIMLPRIRGTVSMFGLLGDRSILHRNE